MNELAQEILELVNGEDAGEAIAALIGVAQQVAAAETKVGEEEIKKKQLLDYFEHGFDLAILAVRSQQPFKLS